MIDAIAARERVADALAALYGEARARDELMPRVADLVARHRAAPDRVAAPRRPADDAAPILIAYADMVRAPGEPPLRTLRRWLAAQVGEAIPGLHLLPFAPASGDDGFAVIDYRQVDPAVGDWSAVEALARERILMVDLVINHVSVRSEWVRAYREGLAPYRDYFIEIAPETDLGAVVRPRTSPLPRPIMTSRGPRQLWATFGEEQIDLDVRQPEVLLELLDILLGYVRHGARILRLDAIAYLWKELGTPCIHLPQTHTVVRLLRALLDWAAPGVRLLTETNVPQTENLSYFGAGDEAHLVYQFSLPPLLLHALETGCAERLADWLEQLPPPPPGGAYFNFTASHDGIGLRPLEGLLSDAEQAELVERMRRKGGQISWRARADGGRVPYELNIAYPSALSFPEDTDPGPGLARFLCSQVLLLSLQGIPGIYFNSLIGAPNDLDGMAASGQARRINRRKWRLDELDTALADPSSPAARVLAGYRAWLDLRRDQPALRLESPQQVLRLPPGLFGLRRGGPEQGQELLVLANLTRAPRALPLAGLIPGFARRHWQALGAGWSRPGHALPEVQLDPYQVLWLAAATTDHFPAVPVG